MVGDPEGGEAGTVDGAREGARSRVGDAEGAKDG
jgi:hypothetical protein